MKTITIVKIGGNVINDEKELSIFLEKFNQLEGKKLLVHGGGKTSSELSRKMGIEPTMINGRRITDKNTLDIAVMVYGGLINKQIVSKLQNLDCNAIGLTGADANIISAIKRPVGEIDYGFAGDIKTNDVNTDQLIMFLENGLTPVLCSLTYDKNTMLNTNADTIASVVAGALSSSHKVKLIYCFEKNGVLNDINNDQSVIDLLSLNKKEKLKAKGVIAEGMLPKLDNGYTALMAGVENVIIKNAKSLLKDEGTKLSL